MNDIDLSRLVYVVRGASAALLAGTLFLIFAAMWPAARRRIGLWVPGAGFVLALAIGGWGARVQGPWLVLVAVTVVFARLAGDRPRAALITAGASIGLLAAVGLVPAEARWLLATAPLVALLLDDCARHRTALLVDSLLLTGTVGLFLTLPDTELALLLGGLLAGHTLIRALAGSGAIRGSLAGLLAAVLVWVVIAHGSARDTALIGGFGCLGVILLEPPVRRLLAGFGRSVRWPSVLLLVLHAGFVVFAARIVGLAPDPGAAVRLLAAGLAVVILLLVSSVFVFRALGRVAARGGDPPRILYLVTHPMTADLLLRGQLSHLREQGFEVAIGSAPGAQLQAVAAREGVEVFELPIVRAVAPWRDLRALGAIVSLCRRYRPDVVNASTPKAAFLGLLGARIAGVPHRLFLLRGLRSETMTGIAGAIQRWTERACSRLATVRVAVSASLARRATEIGIEGNFLLLEHGSSNGVDSGRFRFDPAARERLRAELSVPEEARVIGFVGRLTASKGVGDLVAAFGAVVAGDGADVRLVLVGPFEEGDPVGREIAGRVRGDQRIHHVPWADDAAPWYSIFDLVAFPSYREGLPNVPLEAACCERPVVGYSAVGTVDVVRSGETGELAPVGDREALTAALRRYVADSGLCRKQGRVARQQVIERFSRERIWRGWAELYRSLAARAGTIGT